MRRSDHDTEEGEEEHPFHKECLAHHLGWMCVVCEKPLPMVTKVDDTDGRSTKVEFLKHPFFERERMCPHHAGPITTRSTVLPNNTNDNNDNNNNTTLASSEEVIGEIRRCAGCHRFEPLFASPSKHFIDVGDRDTGRCVCLACCRTVVTGSEDVGPLWEKVINFFEGPLGLLTSEESNCAVGQDHNLMGVTRRALERIPVMVVGMEALNDNMRREYRSGAAGHIMTRGLCLSERCGQHGRDDAGFGGVGVTAVLCLSGLPSDLTASILAHGEKKTKMSLLSLFCVALLHRTCRSLPETNIDTHACRRERVAEPSPAWYRDRIEAAMNVERTVFFSYARGSESHATAR